MKNGGAKSEIENRARFNLIRYAQVWEDADLLLDALNVKEGEVVLSIASAGDNAFALAAQNPSKVYAVDLNFEQIACCELRKAMYRELSRAQHLAFGGVGGNCADRAAVFERLKPALPQNVREYWERNGRLIEKGFMTQGKFEKYFELFRKAVLPLVHTRREVAELIAQKTDGKREEFYEKVWNNARWRLMFKIFFSRFVMGRLGRDKEFFAFVEGGVANRVSARARSALTELDTRRNPYLHFILYGKYTDVFPYALREENYSKIRSNLDKIEFRKTSAEAFIAGLNEKIDAFNLSDIFEYMTQESADALYAALLEKANGGARFAYWNMLAPRECSAALREKYGVKTNAARNAEFLKKDKAFFYSKFYLDTVT